MTVIGTMPSLDFIKYLFKSLSRQNDIVSYGRIQIFAIMRPGDYVVSDSLIEYKKFSVHTLIFITSNTF